MGKAQLWINIKLLRPGYLAQTRGSSTLGAETKETFLLFQVFFLGPMPLHRDIAIFTAEPMFPEI